MEGDDSLGRSRQRFSKEFMKQKIIVFSTTYFPLVGGAEVAMKEITDRLPNIEFHLFCARIKSDLPSTEKIGNITVHRVGFGIPFDKFLLPLLGSISALRIYSDVGHPNMVWALMASYGGFAALVYMWFRTKSKLLLTLQEGDPLEHYAKRAGFFRFLHKMIFRRANAVQAISRFLGVWATDMGFRGTPVIIPNGVDVEKFARRRRADDSEQITVNKGQLGYSKEDVVIVTTSRLSLKNGIDDLINSLSFLPENNKLLVVGEGEDRERLENLVAEKSFSARVKFLGKKDHDELPAILQSSDIFCRPSLSEGLGNSFLEAMAAGIPIIGTPVGGIPDFLLDGQTGLFCRVRDPESIADAVKKLEGDSELRSRIVSQAQELVRRKYDWSLIASNMGDLITSLSV